MRRKRSLKAKVIPCIKWVWAAGEGATIERMPQGIVRLQLGVQGLRRLGDVEELLGDLARCLHIAAM